MVNNKFTENELATELMAIELMADAAQNCTRLTLSQARKKVLLGHICLKDVLGAKDL